MESSNRIEKILQEYHEFCLSLLNNIPLEIFDKDHLAQDAYILKEELQEEISKRKTWNDYYSPAIIDIKTEISKRLK